ncbi:MAG: DUF4296 domain-containing protein [Nonlabens sp.]
MKKLILFVALLGFFSCENVEKSPKPDPFFDQDKMSDILTDMYLIEGAQSSNRLAFLNTAIRPDSFLYNKYEMDSLIYQKNFHYYVDHADLYVQLLEQTEKKLVNIKEKVLHDARLKKEQKRVEDSIKNANSKNKPDLNKLRDSLKQSNSSKKLNLKINEDN